MAPRPAWLLLASALAAAARAEETLCSGQPTSTRRVPRDTCSHLDNSKMMYFRGRCDAGHLNATVYFAQVEPRAEECQSQEGQEPPAMHYPTGVCFKVYGTEWSVITCEAGVTVVRSWGRPKARAPPSPRRLRCSDALARAGSVGVAYEVNASLVDLVSFEVALASDPRRRPSLHFTAAAEQGPAATAAIPGLVPGESYVVEARAHLRNHSEGDPNTWSNLTQQRLVCTSPPASGPRAAPGAPSKPSAPRPRTRWLEVYRQNTNGELPDFLDDHNSADFFSQFSTYATIADEAQRPITRYCVEILDVVFNDTTTASTSGKAGPSPFADFGSCMGGQCVCQVSADRMIARQPAAQIEAACPSLDDTMMCQCSSAALERTQRFTGMMPVPLPFHMEFPENCTLPKAYPFPFSEPVRGHWFSHPGGGRCPPGAAVGAGGCTWQRAPLSHSVYVDDLVRMGLNTSRHMSGRKFMTDEAVSLQDVEVGRRAFGALHLPPCGAAAAQPQTEGGKGASTVVLV